ncbi:MAG: membrane protein insertase YidC, partial [Pseudomonadales bacterium]
MNQTLAKYALYAIIAGLTILLLGEWNRFSTAYDAEQEAVQRAMQQAPLDPALPGITSQSVVSGVGDTADAGAPQIPVQQAAGVPAEPAVSLANTSTRTISVQTDTLRVLIDKLGGDIIEVALLKHLTTLEDDAEPLRLLEKNRLRIYTAQSGL